jgi:hypothetical protein
VTWAFVEMATLHAKRFTSIALHIGLDGLSRLFDCRASKFLTRGSLLGHQRMVSTFSA